MKAYYLSLVCFGLAVVRPVTVEGQFLKSLANSVKQTLQSRANGKTDQTTNHLLDKVDSATRIGGGTKGGKGATGTGSGGAVTGNGGTVSGNGGTLPGGGMTGGGKMDTSGMGRVLGAFAKTAAENPNDTNQADLVMKSLGRIAGGDGVSAADSAKAIKSFMTASGGSGVVYQTITTTTSKRGSTRDTSYAYLTNNGEGRSEMSIPIPGVKTPKMVNIGRANEPTYSVTLDADAKTYGLNVIDTALINSDFEKYQVTRIGTESVGGYSCTHVRIVTSTGSGMFKSSSTMDMWMSTAVPGYAIYSKLLSLHGSQGGLLGALNKSGANGFLVKMTAGDGKEYTMTMQLNKAEMKSFPASMFVIPAGYKGDGESNIQRLMSGSKAAKKP
jgi:hypothetical protein